jgi:restriction system protein
MKPNRDYFRIMLGKKSIHAQECYDDGFIGGHWGMDMDLTNKLPDDWRKFNHEFIPEFLKRNPGKSKVAAGLACGMLHTICRGIRIGDVILSPKGDGNYYIGEITSEYYYSPGKILPHRRSVKWYPNIIIERTEMSQELKNSTGSVGTVSKISKYADEINKLLNGIIPPPDPDLEDPVAFAFEKHLEDFLVHNWAATELGKQYEIFSEDDEIVGKQFPTDTGPIDILAIRKDKRELLVVELKKGRASDAVVGQIQRYMGYVLEELAEKNQSVRGIIIAMEDDLRLRRALAVAQNIEFYRYQIGFKLFKNNSKG